MSTLLRARHDPRLLSLITPRRGGTEHGYFREGGLWPQSPRNFAAAPATWYDVQSWVSTNVSYSDDYEVEISFLSAVVPAGSILYADNSFVGLYAYGDGRVLFFDKLGYGYAGIALTTTAQANTWYTIKFLSIGGTGKLFFDGIQVGQKTKSATYWNHSIAPRSSFNGNIGGFRITNITTGKIWAYPSESERLRLITTNGNVLAGDRYFEAANPAVEARIDSQIDLRGVVSDYTVAVDFEAVEFISNGTCQNLAGQGPSVAGQTPICALGYTRNSVGDYFLQLTHEIAGNRQPLQVSVSPLTGRHVAAGRIALGASSTTLSILLDGVQIGSRTYPGLPTGIAYSTYTTYAINDNRNGIYTIFFGKIYAAALFNRSIPDSQIDLMCH